MMHEVSVGEVAARPTAVVAATTTWREFPRLWQPMLDEVWACLRVGGVTSGCRNVMRYRDDMSNGALNVEVGVLLTTPCVLTGRVVASELPAARVARTVHIGPYAELGAAHQAVLTWCAAEGLRTTGTRWEIYGPHDPAEPWTEISYELA
jgi:effector-binding domain-containing protein